MHWVRCRWWSAAAGDDAGGMVIDCNVGGAMVVDIADAGMDTAAVEVVGLFCLVLCRLDHLHQHPLRLLHCRFCHRRRHQYQHRHLSPRRHFEAASLVTGRHLTLVSD